ncbi:MAG: hypothetical protein V7703_19805, partial [Hyphomicrobiales bacterium]
MRNPILVAALILLSACGPADEQSKVFSSVTDVDLPVSQGAREPSMFHIGSGRILASWTELADNGYAVRTAIGNDKGWSSPVTVIETDRLFVNWADYPSVAAFNDGTMAVHWLIENGSSSFGYNVNVALSSGKGRSWRAPIVPHSDRSKQQHGFVTLLPTKQNRLMAVWLDGRAYETDGNVSKSETFTNAMQLRTTTIGSDGSLSEDALLDIRTCSCCQTAAAIT